MVQDKRKARRQAITQGGVISDRHGHLICSCTLSDVSKTGARLKLPAEHREVPAEFILVLSRGGRVRRHCEVVWREGDLLGVRFVV